MSQNSMITEGSVALSGFMSKVYAWMTGALLVTALVSFNLGSNPDLMKFFFPSPNFIWLYFIPQLLLVIFITRKIDTISHPIAILMFMIYSILMGFTISFIFIVYTNESIASVFFITAAMFASLSLFGYFTKRDLTGLGSFMFMGLIGIIIASVVNIFLKSEMIYWVITYAGVLIFAGLTAADTQKIKKLGIQASEMGEEAFAKYSIIGALVLYLDFINLFLFLLRIFGRRR